jgi:hypothetical protein
MKIWKIGKLGNHHKARINNVAVMYSPTDIEKPPLVIACDVM